MINSQSEIYSQVDPQLSHVFVSIVLRDQNLHVNRKTAPFLRFKSVLHPFLSATLLLPRNKLLDHSFKNPYQIPFFPAYLSSSGDINMPLNTLPAEVLTEITAFLPTGSVASLALCNKNIWAKIGTQSWKDLSNWPQCQRSADMRRLRKEKAALLTFLQLGLTDLIYCSRCQKLCNRNGHNPSNRSHPCIQYTGVLDLVYAQGNSRTGAPSKVYSLAYLDLQLLMSHYRSLCRNSSQDHQPSAPQLAELFNNLRLVAHVEVGDKGRCVIGAKVVDDDLLLRMKTRITFADPKEFEQILMHLPEICQHAPWIWWNNLEWENVHVYQTYNGAPYRCGYCHTECLATIKKEPQEGKYVVEVCVWKNLGSFKSSLDKRWQCHLSHGRMMPRWSSKLSTSQRMISYKFEYAEEEGALVETNGCLCKDNGKVLFRLRRRTS